MRVFINGFEIEGTPEEIRVLVAQQEATKPQEAEVKPIIKSSPPAPPNPPAQEKIIFKGKKRREDYKNFLNSILDYSIKNNITLGEVIENLYPERKCLSGRERKKIIKMGRKLGYDYKPRIGFIKIGEDDNPIIKKRVSRKGDDTDARVRRMRWISHKAKSLTYNNAMSYEKALRFATDEWLAMNNGVKLKKIVFPSMVNVSENFKPIIKDIVEKVINDKGVISFVGDAYAIGIDNVKDWLGFVADFIRKSDEVAGSFGVPNLFKVVSNMSIKYGA